MILAALLLSSATPVRSPAEWITTGDYPSEALEAGIEGATAVKLEIDRSGVPIKCLVTRSSGSEMLDNSSCDLLLERARFEHAVSGEKQTFETVVQWKIPPPPKLPLSTAGFAAVSQLSNGQVIGECRMERFGPVLEEEIDLCEIFEDSDGLSALGIAQIEQSSVLQVRIMIVPEGGTLPSAHLFSPAAHSQILVRARFTVNANGIPSKCAVEESNMGSNADGLCDEMISSGQEFDTSGATIFPAKMQLVVDFTHE